MAIQYTLSVLNNSVNPGTVCLYQTDPGFASVGPAYSVAWLAHQVFPSTMVQFSWQMNYGFACAETGRLTPGMIFQAAQYVPGNLNTANQITLTSREGVLQLENQQGGSRSGALVVRQDATIPVNTGS